MLDIKGAIFDIDGTLLDSMPVWERIAGDFLRSREVVPRQNLNRELLGVGGHEIPRYFKVEYGLQETEEEIQKGIYSLLEDFYHNKAALKPGVFAVLDALRNHGVRMCAATATDRWLMEPALKRCGIAMYFDRIFTCREEKTSKSSPDIYVRAASYMKTDIENTVVFEDAPYAVKSAKNAGFFVIAVYDGSTDGKVSEIKMLCDYYCQSLDDFMLNEIITN